MKYQMYYWSICKRSCCIIYKNMKQLNKFKWIEGIVLKVLILEYEIISTYKLCHR